MTDVLIIGANASGLILASKLMQQGVQVTLIDHREYDEEDSHITLPHFPIALSCSSLELLHNSQLYQGLETIANKTSSACYNWKNKKLYFQFVHGNHSPTPHVLTLTHRQFIRHLIQKFLDLGGNILWGKRPVTLVDSSIFIENVNTTTQFENREVYTPQCIIACEADDNPYLHDLIKSWSKVKKITKENYLVPCSTSEEFSQDTIHLLPHTKNFLNFLFYNPETQSNQLLISDHSSIHPKTCAYLKQVHQIECEYPGSSCKIQYFHTQPTEVQNILFLGTTKKTFTFSYLFGINSNIHEACNLAWKILPVVRKAASHVLIKQQETESAPLFPYLNDAVQDRTSRLPFIRTCTPAVAYYALKSFQKWHPNRGDRLDLHQTLHYSDSSLIKLPSGNKTHYALQPGYRAIDYQMPDKSFLLDPLSASKHLLLFFKDSPELIQAIHEEYGQWIDSKVIHDPKIQELYQATANSLFIIRPDRYIGYCSRNFKPQELVAYLLRIFAIYR